MEQDRDFSYSLEKPVTLYDCITKFESGQVYEVLYKDTRGNFISNVKLLNDVGDKDTHVKEGREKRFLIYIIQREVKFNDEAHIMTFFKDITFGVLYEQIKAQEEL